MADHRQGGNYTQAMPIIGPGEPCYGAFVGWELVGSYSDEDAASNAVRAVFFSEGDKS